MPKFEVRTKSETDLTYGIWNNHMIAFQYISEWGGTETISLDEANNICESMNYLHDLIS